jgi:hypothetical protein
MRLPQGITGPLVNALLLITVETIGIGSAVLVGLITPLSALVYGVLPLPLMIMIPFIGTANAVLSTAYGALKERSRWMALVVAAVLKFVCLYAATVWLTVRPLEIAVNGTSQAVQMPSALITMMQWPQLATALAGGAIAFSLRWLANRIPG